MKTIATLAVAVLLSLASPVFAQEPITYAVPAVVYQAPVVYEGPVIYQGPVLYQAPVIYQASNPYDAPLLYETEGYCEILAPGVYYFPPHLLIIGQPANYEPAYYPPPWYRNSDVIYFGGLQGAREGYHFSHPR